MGAKTTPPNTSRKTRKRKTVSPPDGPSLFEQPRPADPLVAKAERLLSLKKQAGEMYQECEVILSELATTHAPKVGERCGPPIRLSASQVFQITDPFIDKKTGLPCKQWKHSPVARFDCETATG